MKLAFLFGLIVTPAFGQAVIVSACGSVNYTSEIGRSHQLTINPSGYLCVSSTTTTTQEAPVKEPEKPEREPRK